MKTVIVTGSQGFLGTYLCKDLLEQGYKVVGYDNYSKYGRVERPHDKHPNFKLVECDLSKVVPDFASHGPDYVILGAAMIGGISYFHKYAFDLVRTNERILANCYDAILGCFAGNKFEQIFGTDNVYEPRLERVVTISSSMVFEGADAESDKLHNLAAWNCCGPNNFPVDPNSVWPSKESDVETLPPPKSTYGFQKLSCEYWAKGAWEQYKLPYTIVRPFNAVGAYENEAIGEKEVMSGNVRLQMSHVLPDLLNKCLKGQDPLHLLGDGSQIRCYTNGTDIARGIRMAMESPNGRNNDFNISTDRATSVMELSRMVWKKVNGDKPFNFVCDEPFEYDVQKRIPDVTKAKKLLGFEARVPLEQSIDEVYQWMVNSG